MSDPLTNGSEVINIVLKIPGHPATIKDVVRDIVTHEALNIPTGRIKMVILRETRRESSHSCSKREKRQRRNVGRSEGEVDVE